MDPAGRGVGQPFGDLRIDDAAPSGRAPVAGAASGVPTWGSERFRSTAEFRGDRTGKLGKDGDRPV